MSPRSENARKRGLAMVGAAGAVFVVVLSLAQYFGRPYPLELLSHFQVQYFLVATGSAAILAGLRRWVWLPAALAGIVISGSALLPYQPILGSSAHAAPAGNGDWQTLRVLLANVHYGNRAHERVLDVVRAADADLLIFQEVNPRWMNELESLRASYPHVVSRPREDAFGVVVMSRLPLDGSSVRLLGSMQRPSIVARLTIGDRPLTVVTTHPLNPLTREWFELRNEQMEEVSSLVGELSGPILLVGDLNMTMWSPWYRRFCAETRLVNARRGFGVLASWPAYLPPMLRLPIDHCLVSDDLEIADIRLGRKIGSDHLPLIVDVKVQ